MQWGVKEVIYHENAKRIEECTKNILSSLGHLRFLQSLKKMREEAEEWARK